MSDDLKALKDQFDAALREYVSAMNVRKLALEEALLTESKEIERRYQAACEYEERMADAYRKLGDQLRTALLTRH